MWPRDALARVRAPCIKLEQCSMVLPDKNLLNAVKAWKMTIKWRTKKKMFYSE